MGRTAAARSAPAGEGLQKGREPHAGMPRGGRLVAHPRADAGGGQQQAKAGERPAQIRGSVAGRPRGQASRAPSAPVRADRARPATAHRPRGRLRWGRRWRGGAECAARPRPAAGEARAIARRPESGWQGAPRSGRAPRAEPGAPPAGVGPSAHGARRARDGRLARGARPARGGAPVPARGAPAPARELGPPGDCRAPAVGRRAAGGSPAGRGTRAACPPRGRRSGDAAPRSSGGRWCPPLPIRSPAATTAPSRTSAEARWR